MKTKLLFLFLSVIFQFSFGQVNEKDIYPLLTNHIPEVMQGKVENKQNLNVSSNVFIQQVGNNNQISTEFTSIESRLHLSQYGDSNSMDFLISSNSTTGIFKQTGNNNYSFAFTHDPQEKINIDLSQTGNNLHFESHGSNSISNKLKFNMNGDFNSIIVRNSK